jgi:hypothetical protein
MNELATRGAVALDRAVDRAIAFLRAEQMEDGEFPSIVAPLPDMGGVSAPDTNYFTTPQVLWSLGFVFHRRPIATLRARAAEFVERGCEAGAWRFFTPKVRRRIDPDVDITACCAAGPPNVSSSGSWSYTGRGSSSPRAPCEYASGSIPSSVPVRGSGNRIETSLTPSGARPCVAGPQLAATIASATPSALTAPG